MRGIAEESRPSVQKDSAAVRCRNGRHEQRTAIWQWNQGSVAAEKEHDLGIRNVTVTDKFKIKEKNEGLMCKEHLPQNPPLFHRSQVKVNPAAGYRSPRRFMP